MSLPGIDGDPGRGDPAAVRTDAAVFATRASELRARAESARSALVPLGALEAESVDALRPRVVGLAGRFDDAAEASDDVAGVLGAYATALDDLRARAAAALVRAHDAYSAIWTRRSEALNAASEFVTGWALGWDDVLPSWMYASDRGYLQRWQDAIDDYRLAASAFQSLVSEREGLDRATADSLRGVDLFAGLAGAATVAGRMAAARVWAGDLAGLGADDLAALGDPELVRQVWTSLDPQQQAALIAASPLIIGNLDGIPIRDRATANRINVRTEIDARQAEIDRLERIADEAVANAPYGKDAVRAQYDRLIAEQQALIDSFQGLLDQQVRWVDQDNTVRVDEGARLVVFDPSRNAIATYHGPLDPVTGDIPSWVRNVAVSVPGTGTTMTSFGDGTAADLAAYGGKDTAVFQWAGGAFPGTIPEATQSSYARDLAPRLRDFAAGIAVPDGAALTVLGHSYGGATVGLAEQAGLRADRILYVSAAGMGSGVSGLDDFPNTADVPHYSLMTRNDLVVGLIQGDGADDLHGQSALTADGVIRLETGFVEAGDPSSGGLEDYNVPGNWSPPAIDGHSTVYKPGTTAFENIIAVITGGTAELYAPDEMYVAGDRVVVVDGIDRSDYAPRYTDIP